ncbi:MAG: hypothetical protein QME58_10625 [Bacteroidota bacterium]|nr:hypothetical protein [Bacteroidota bacterium]
MQNRSFKLTSFLALLIFISNSIFAQVNWEKYSGNPVIPSSGYDYYYTLAPSIIFDDSTNTFHCWFTSRILGAGLRISYAYSSDGVNWTKYTGNPVLSPTQGTFDESEIKGCSVIKDNVGYKMYYTGYKSSVKLSMK